MDTLLTFINRSEQSDHTEIAIFQKNVTVGMSELALAWKVIRNCGRDCYHPFTYAQDFEVVVGDEWGNFSPCLSASSGQALSVTPTASGRRLANSGRSIEGGCIEVSNDLRRGAIDVTLRKSGAAIARKTGVTPAQKAVFEFKPVLWLSVVSEVVQGAALDSAVVSAANTEFSLLGIASAEIVMRGGGGGATARPFTFTLENVRTH
jgi:hypothetical protein